MPKQMLDLVTERTMLQETVHRVTPIIPPENIYVVTGRAYADIVRQQLPELPGDNIIVEPSGRSTAPCVGLAALHILRRDPDAVMASLHADHVIRDAEGFRQALLAAANVAEDGVLVTLGIQPTYPATGFGYIHRGEQVATSNGLPVFRVRRFVEKPPLPKAREYLESGEYYWNSGIFIWKAATILDEMRVHLPELHAQLMRIGQALDDARAPQVLEEVWEQVRPVSIDVGVMERAGRVLVLPLDVGWSDVGDWAALAALFPQDEDGNVVVRAEHVGVDTTGCLVYGSGRLVATLGLKDLVIVDTGDVVLVCPKDRTQDVRLLVDRLRARGDDRYL
ncbi:MAG: mannose-1-phosphate guanyltransferase, partial [Anaerolineae bacterium]|nr:mannose-1-phosphate guanyltransferase [Anaerolineae bacterium]